MQMGLLKQKTIGCILHYKAHQLTKVSILSNPLLDFNETYSPIVKPLINQKMAAPTIGVTCE